MKKLTLDIDRLRVESFATEPAVEARGTVHGHAHPPGARRRALYCGGTPPHPPGRRHMKKLRLDVEALQVESFATGRGGGPVGTVHGFNHTRNNHAT